MERGEMGKGEVAVYGGSFNPPHLGHAMVAAWLLWSGRVEEVWLVPTYEHPFGKPLAPFERRLEWCRAMARDVGHGLRVLDVERDLPAPSYTLQTLRALAARHPERRLHLVLGADALESVHCWHDWPSIAREFAPIVVGRQGYRPVEGSPSFPDLSSSEVRRRLREGLSVEGLVSRSVLPLLGDFRGQP